MPWPRLLPLALLLMVAMLLLLEGAQALACSSSVVLSSPRRRSRKNSWPDGPPMPAVGMVPPPPLEDPPSSGLDCRAIVAAADVSVMSPTSPPPIKSLVSGRSASGLFESCVEVGLTTAGSFMTGGVLGYIIGLGVGVAQKGAFAHGLGGLLKALHAKGAQTGSSWGLITACFSGFTSAARVIRGSEDSWNHILGSCGTGALMCRNRGPAGMLQGCVSYGAFSYILDMLGGHPTATDDLDFVDIPVEDGEGPRRPARRRWQRATTSRRRVTDSDPSAAAASGQ